MVASFEIFTELSSGGLPTPGFSTISCLSPLSPLSQSTPLLYCPVFPSDFVGTLVVFMATQINR